MGSITVLKSNDCTLFHNTHSFRTDRMCMCTIAKINKGICTFLRWAEIVDLKRAVMQELNLFHVLFDFDKQKKGSSSRLLNMSVVITDCVINCLVTISLLHIGGFFFMATIKIYWSNHNNMREKLGLGHISKVCTLINNT